MLDFLAGLGAGHFFVQLNGQVKDIAFAVGSSEYIPPLCAWLKAHRTKHTHAELNFQ